MNATNTLKHNTAVIVPVLNPQADLACFIKELLDMGTAHVIIVNDGSGKAYDSIFNEVAKLKDCTVLRHEVNKGKGRALKTAFSHFMQHFPDMDGVVTADADGQHAVDDIIKICEILSMKKNKLILGVRNFKEKTVPKASYIGNHLSSIIFRLLYGIYINDTQTGLRGIPSAELSWMTDLKGERYDYEINMLIKARKLKIGIISIPIKTLYFNNNSGSHYKLIKDSAYIFKYLILGIWLHRGAVNEKQNKR